MPACGLAHLLTHLLLRWLFLVRGCLLFCFFTWKKYEDDDSKNIEKKYKKKEKEIGKKEEKKSAKFLITASDISSGSPP